VSEFDLIRRCLCDLGAPRSDVVLGVGDDCALLEVPAGVRLAVSIDTLVSGVHFLPDTDPEGLGHKSLAVGLSDLASMGAEPAWATLALTLPPGLAAGEAPWVVDFARGLSGLAADHGVRVVGGDTTGGPLAISIQVHGFVPAGMELRRSGARPGDLVCVSGTLGDAGLALRALLAGARTDSWSRHRLERPTPRVALGLALRGLASAVIDCSDGLHADLGHILEASGVGAELELAALPLSPGVAAAVGTDGDWDLPLASGDDYELCFCLPRAREDRLADLSRQGGCDLKVIGRVRAASGLVCRGRDGRAYTPVRGGYDHFAFGVA
jgi:thiamine-monophosphate kinase